MRWGSGRLTDITEHPTREGKVYCAAVLDVFTRQVVGWSIADHMRSELVLDALQMATRWLSAEPDDDIRMELQGLIDGDPATLTERFSGGLTFGTAGLRAAVGAGAWPRGCRCSPA